MTYREMCELIAKYWEEVFNFKVKPTEIFNYSPSGELFSVHVWYRDAKEYFDWKEDNNENTSNKKSD